MFYFGDISKSVRLRIVSRQSTTSPVKSDVADQRRDAYALSQQYTRFPPFAMQTMKSTTHTARAFGTLKTRAWLAGEKAQSAKDAAIIATYFPDFFIGQSPN